MYVRFWRAMADYMLRRGCSLAADWRRRPFPFLFGLDESLSGPVAADSGHQHLETLDRELRHIDLRHGDPPLLYLTHPTSFWQLPRPGKLGADSGRLSVQIDHYGYCTLK
jgi:hypothetical protein